MKRDWKTNLLIVGTVVFLILLCLPAMFIEGCQPPGEMVPASEVSASKQVELLEEQIDLLKEQNRYLEELVQIERNRKW